jgi:hypothetical protein
VLNNSILLDGRKLCLGCRQFLTIRAAKLGRNRRACHHNVVLDTMGGGGEFLSRIDYFRESLKKLSKR